MLAICMNENIIEKRLKLIFQLNPNNRMLRYK